MPIFAALNNEFFDACTAAADLAVSLGRPETVLVPLHLAARIAPLHQPVQAGLITVLGAAERQVDALAVFALLVRTRLAEDLGLIRPGPGGGPPAGAEPNADSGLRATVDGHPEVWTVR